MLFYYVNGADRTTQVVANTLKIQNQIQQRTDSCSFKIFSGTAPAENQDIKVYDGALIDTQVGAVLTLKDSYQDSVNKFRAGQKLVLNIGDVNEEVGIVDSYDESTRTVTLTQAPTNALSADDKIGELIFGGVVARVKDMNIQTLDNIEYQVTGVDYTKIFDKKIIADTWEDVDSRYIINDFVNTTVNYNTTLDNLDYDDNAAIQAEWVDSSDADNPTVDSADFLEGDASGVFPWTNAGGTALWEATPTTKDISDFTGIPTGSPTKGHVMSWFKTSSQADITSVKIRIGSDNANYAVLDVTLTDSTDWQYVQLDLTDAVIVGSPDWENVDYAAIQVVQTADGEIRWNGLRINAANSFTLYAVTSTPTFDDLRSPQLKPTVLINQIAKTWEYVWYIDYFRDIHFASQETEPAPYSITDNSDNFTNMRVECDTSNIGNRVIVRGGEKTSDSLYAQVVEGDSAVREWLMKNKFKNLSILFDNNTSTDLCEAGTNATTINATAHGLSVGDHIVNRTRSDAVRAVLTVPDADSFTVESVTGQTNGDTFSKFDTSKTVGIEGIADEATVDYVFNSNEKSIRATESEATLDPGDFLRFSYNERLPIQLQYSDSASANALKALGLGDGIFDLDPITDRNIQDTTTAIAVAQARVKEFANAIVTVTFRTDQARLIAGQLLHVEESTARAINDDYVIQKVTASQREGRFKDYFEYTVVAGTTLFGWIEFMQKLLRTKDSIELNVDDIVETFATSDEVVEMAETNSVDIGGDLNAQEAEIVEMGEVNNVSDFSPPWKWEPNGAGQPLNTRWNLFEWG